MTTIGVKARTGSARSFFMLLRLYAWYACVLALACAQIFIVNCMADSFHSLLCTI